MKNFIKDILIFLLLMVFVTMIFQGIGNQNQNNKENQTQENIDLMEDQLSNNNQVNDGFSEEEDVEVKQSANVISKILNSLAKFFTSAINFIISLIMKLISAFLS